MFYSPALSSVALFAWLLAMTAPAPAQDNSAAPECEAVTLETASLPRCARLLQETSRLYNYALSLERLGHRKVALGKYSEAVASAKRPIELFLAGTVPENALRRRGILRRDLGEISEAMADFNALIDADRGNPDARHERSRTHLELGRLGEALADSDVALWLKPHVAEFHSLRASILARLGRAEDAAAASIEAENLAVQHLTALQRTLQGIGPRLSEERWAELAKQREILELELSLRGIAPVAIRQRFRLQWACQDDDRHMLSLRLEQGRMSIVPSQAGPAGSMAVEASNEKLVFTLGAQPCQVRVVIGKGDQPADAPPATDDGGARPLSKTAGLEPITYSLHPASVAGCASGSATIRAY